MKLLALFTILLFHLGTFAQTNGPTALQIVQRSIDSSGGEAKLDEVRSLDMIFQLSMPDSQKVFLAIKKKDADKYTVSMLGTGHVNSTTVYNNGKAINIRHDSVKRISNPAMLEDLRLQCFPSIDLGYKRLGYKLTRFGDQKFQDFDCYTVMAESSLGNSTLNFYDKKSGRLIMIIHASQQKSLFIQHNNVDGVSIPSRILMVDTRGNITESTLQKILYPKELDAGWFTIAEEGPHKAPDTFRTGTYHYLGSNDGTVVHRDDDKQTETATGYRSEYTIQWDDNNNYLLYRLKNASRPPTDDNTEYIKVRITGWTSNSYFCQYITSDNKGGSCAFKKID